MWATITTCTFIDKGTERLSDLPKVTRARKINSKGGSKKGQKCGKRTQIVGSKIAEMNAILSVITINVHGLNLQDIDCEIQFFKDIQTYAYKKPTLKMRINVLETKGMEKVRLGNSEPVECMIDILMSGKNSI